VVSAADPYVRKLGFIILFNHLNELCCLACSHSELILKLRILQTVGRAIWTDLQDTELHSDCSLS
jgi:hypothetical protein